MVLDAAVVPEGDRVLLPAKEALEQRVRQVLEEILQDAGALVARDTVNVTGEALVDIERLAAGHGMGSHDRMISERVALLVRYSVIRILPAIMLAVMTCGQTIEIGLHPVGERVVSGVHVGEQGVAAMRRAFPDVEDRTHRR